MIYHQISNFVSVTLVCFLPRWPCNNADFPRGHALRLSAGKTAEEEPLFPRHEQRPP